MLVSDKESWLLVCGGEEDGEFVLYVEGATIGEVRVDGGDKLFLDEAMLLIDSCLIELFGLFINGNNSSILGKTYHV